jgi:hypothetical protein
VSPGAPAATLGEEHDRQAPAFGDLEQAVLLAVVLLPWVPASTV